MSNVISHTYIGVAKRGFQLNAFKRKWRKQNKHNDTIPNLIFPISCVRVGIASYGELNVLTFNNKSILKIGNYVSMSKNVHFLLDAEHNIATISTFPFNVKCLACEKEAISKGDIVVDDDVWIGYGATILSGIHIGQGAVIAAGAVVTKDVLPYAVVGGVPAKVIKYRFKSEIIQELLKVDYGKLTKEMIKDHIEDLYYELTDVSQLEWMPRK